VRHIQDNRVMVLYHAITLGSVRAAADKLGVAPSSVSRQIAQLEADLAIPLIERGRRGVKPTEAGEILFDYHRERMAQTEAVEIRLDELQGLRRGHVSLAVGEGFIGDFFAEPLRRFCQRYPGVTLDVGIHGSRRIVELLSGDEAHIGLLFNPEPEMHIRTAARRAQPLMAVMSPTHPLAQVRGPLPMSAFGGVPLAVMHESFGIQTLIRRAEVESGMRLSPTLRSNSIAMLRDFARSGLGVTFLPRFAIVRELLDGSLLTTPVQSEAFLAAEVQVVLRRGRRLSFAGEKLLTLFSAALAALPD